LQLQDSVGLTEHRTTRCQCQVSLESQLASERAGRDRAQQKIRAVEEHVAMLMHASRQQLKALNRERELLMSQPPAASAAVAAGVGAGAGAGLDAANAARLMQVKWLKSPAPHCSQLVCRQRQTPVIRQLRVTSWRNALSL
jgi:pyridoxine 5'-phosphate synthase PdxJ